MAAGWRGLLVAALLLAGFAFKGSLIEPRASSPPFNTERALARLHRVLGDQRPHPVDSDADDAVRARLIAELSAIGLQPRIQEAMDCSAMPKTRAVSCSRVHNVIAVIPSRRDGPALLLNAHYDSTPTGPGAGDDGIGVATLLEVGSILKAAPPPRPVILLFNEGEEFGLNGAHAFLRDPAANSVNSLINIDARGVNGAPVMFETSDPNGAPVTLYAAATQRPNANSISTDFAKLIPNTTDVVFFKPRGWTLLNYAIIGNETRYHSPGDNLAALDSKSVAQMGDEVLRAAQRIGAVPNPASTSSGRTVFTDLAGFAVFRLPLAVAGIVLAMLLIGGFVLGWRRRALGRPLVVAATMTVGGIATAALIAIALETLRSGDFWRAHPLVAYLAVYSGLLLAMIAVLDRSNESDRERLRIAAWLVVLIVGALLSIALPGASIFFQIGPAIALLGIAVSGRSAIAGSVLAIAGTVIQFVMFAETLALLETLLIDGPLWAVVPLAALAALPALVEASGARLRPALLALGLLFIGTAGASLAMPRASAERPLGFSIDYYRDLTGKTANWAIATKQAPLPTGFPGSWHQGELPYNGRLRWIATAPLLPTPEPEARVIASEPAGQGRRIRLALSTGGANSFAIRFPADARILALGLPGAALSMPAKGEPQKTSLRCLGRSCDGMQIEVLLGDQQPVTAELFATRFGLPFEGMKLEAARPADAQPQYSPDETISRATVRL